MNAKSWPTLYKLNSRNKLQTWTIEAEDTNHVSVYVVTHGQQGGSMQRACTAVSDGKNIGRDNETTAWEQCCLEAESKWKKQRDRKGYSEQVPTEKPMRPMLAKSYHKDGKHITFPAYWQPKLDGIRCLAYYNDNNIVLESRQGKIFKSLPHINAAVDKILAKKDVVLDGELYIHGEEFQTLTSAIKRDTPTKASGKIQYHVYDMISDKPFEERFDILWKLIPQPKKRHKKPVVDLVWTQIVHCVTHVATIHTEQTLRGFEGIMLRNKQCCGYQIDRRSSHLQKYKEFVDEEFVIVGAEENKGKLEGTCTFICKTQSGKHFGVMPKGTQTERENMYQDWQANVINPGDIMTVEFFAWTTSDDPVPRFPVGKCIRDYEG